jgi:hypothetical protein
MRIRLAPCKVLSLGLTHMESALNVPSSGLNRAHAGTSDHAPLFAGSP